MLTLSKAMQQLYDHEINCGIKCFWDGGWDVYIGDDMNGIKSEMWFNNDKLEDAASWLLTEAMRIYPMFAWREEHIEPLLPIIET